MKIISLQFKNLNSLKGEFKIDFTSPTLANAGLFAIMMAGYKPFDIFPKIIDKIYNFYK